MLLSEQRPIGIWMQGGMGMPVTRTGTASQFDCFICYRRSSGFYQAKVIKEHLEKKGISCFLDLEESKPGDITGHIASAIESAANFLLILSEDCLSRCQDPQDWIFQELDLALHFEKRIIPIWMDDFSWPRIELPEKIEKIRFLNSVIFSTNYFDASMNQLYAFLNSESRKDGYPLRRRIQSAHRSSRFFLEALDSPVPVRSVDFAFHAGAYWIRMTDKVDLLLYLIENKIPVRVLINSDQIIEQFLVHMRHPLKKYVPIDENIREWKDLADRFPDVIEVRVVDLPMMHRIYRVRYENGESCLSIRNYLYGNQTSDEDDWVIPDARDLQGYCTEFDYMWEKMSYPIQDVDARVKSDGSLKQTKSSA